MPVSGHTKTLLLCILYVLSGIAGGLLAGVAAMVVVSEAIHIPPALRPVVFWTLLLGGAYKGIARAARTWRARER